MVPLEICPGSGKERSRVLGEIAEEDYFDNVSIRSLNFLKERGLEARSAPAEFGGKDLSL